MDIKKEWDFSVGKFSGINETNYNQILDDDDKYVDYIREKYINVNFKKINASKFKEYLDEVSSEKLMNNYGRVYRYYSFQNSLNTQDQQINKILSSISNRYVDCNEKLAFLSDKIKDVGYDKLIKFSEMPKFKKVKNGIIGMANGIKYLLDIKEEVMLSTMGNINSYTTDDLYSELSNSYLFDMNGEKLREDKLMVLTKSSNAHDRKLAFDKIFEKYKSDSIVYSSIYKSIAKSNAVMSKKRGYSSVMSSRNISEDLSDDTVNKLIEMVKSKIYPLYQKHLKIKAHLLEKPKLDYYDIYARINKNDSDNIEFDEGLKMYLDVIKKFDKGMYDYSLDMFTNGRVSVYPNIGKTGGAYCAYSKNMESYVLLNYTNTYNDVMTLAHEFGHAIHGNLMQVNDSLVYDAPLCLAETASIFTETLLSNELFRKIKDSDTKISMLVDELDGIFSTIVRQIMYTSFEYKCHNSFYQGTELSLDDFNNFWMDELKEMFGDSVNLVDDMCIGWARIPHIFYTPFYCYTYAFGNILSLNLINMYNNTNSKSEFKKVYKKILSSGASVKPENLLLECGIDVKSDEFFNGAIVHINNMIEELSIMLDINI